jgi:hypothetical protein
MDWPPDVAAVTAPILMRSGAYRVVVSPPRGATWPPSHGPFASGDWSRTVQQTGATWARWTQTPAGTTPRPRLPALLATLIKRVQAGHAVAVAELGTLAQWELTCDLISMLAMADEACAGIQVPGSGTAAAGPFPLFKVSAGSLLSQTNSLSRLPTERVRVIPKMRVPHSGITIRSLTRHVAAVESSEVTPVWQDAVDSIDAGRDHATFLLVPWPLAVMPGDFRKAPGPLLNMNPDEYDFFEYSPKDPPDVAALVDLLETARRAVGEIDAVVLPESVLTPLQALAIRRELKTHGNPLLIAGVRQQARSPLSLGSNVAYVSGSIGAVSATGLRQRIYVKQFKHHRWFLDRSQIEQYHLGASLDPNRRWWEAIDVSPRKLTFLTIRDWLTLCPLVCEDLARPDPVADLIRATGPSLVIALLLDGPQLTGRWPARYATVLADDPGSAVLTLSSFGMVQRAKPRDKARSRIVALWKQHDDSPREIELENGAQAIALTVSAEAVRGTAADGRRETETRTYNVFLSGIEQIKPSIGTP